MNRKPRIHGGSNRRARPLVVGWGGVFLALALGGCGGGGRSSLAVLPPPDPPPIPQRRPVAPPSVEAWAPAQIAASGGPAAPGGSVTSAAITTAPLPQIARATPAAVPAGTPPSRYLVQPGDTVYGISRRLTVPLRSVIDANDLAPPYALRIGQILRIPNPRSHIVGPGETVYAISRQYGIDMSELVRMNGIAPPYTISPGMALIVPAEGARTATVAVAAVPRTEPKSVPLGEPQTKIDLPLKPAPPSPQPAVTQPPPAPPPTARLAKIPTPPPRAASKFLWPADGKLIASYGAKDGGLHNDGINIAAPRGAPVRAAENGVVVYSGNELRGFGNLILIKHADGWVTAYAHTDSISVRRGDRVRRGQVIGKVGSTGSVSKPQLHFEIRKGAQAVDPMRLLDRRNA